MRLIQQQLLIILLFWQVTSLAQESASTTQVILTISQVLQKVVDHYPSIKSAALQVEKARQENIKVESQLSWNLQGNAGYNRNTSLFGTASDRMNAGGSLNRNLENGGQLGFNAELSRDDSDDSFGPTVPNPSTKTRVDVNYRHKFGKGAGNPLYTEGLESAEVSEKLAMSDKLGLYDQLATQVIELYLGAAITQSRIKSIDTTIERAERLKKYIQKELNLGLSETKDILQVDARLSINRADKKSLQIIRNKQLVSLNRLMGRRWDQFFVPQILIDEKTTRLFQNAYLDSQVHSPNLKRIEARIQLAESQIRSSKDKRKDDFDLLMYLGNEFNQGETTAGDLDESEVVGGFTIEFKRGLDKSGFDAELRQAYFDKGIALEDKKQELENLQYGIASLLAEIDYSDQALIAFKESVKAENKKLKEALVRYRDGRIETDRIIDFESQLATAELSVDIQKIELIRRQYQLNLLQGEIWKDIMLPEFTFNEYIIENKRQNVQGVNK